ncbi:titin-like [Macrobrachium rosenbergii]|uniref:titin-like n=1 Tax=Macrobrachium rosenbergii TaxID=79674 RepID=UPI0034D571E2
MKPKKKPEPKIEEVTEEVTIKKPEKPEEKVEEVTEEVQIKMKPKKKPEPKIEEVTQEVTIKKPEKPEEKVEEVTEEVQIKMKPKKKPKVETEEVSEEVTLKKPEKPEEKVVEEVTEEVQIKMKPRKRPEVKTEEVSEEVTIKRPEKPEEKVVEEVTEEVQIKMKPKKKPEVKTEEVSEEVTIKKPQEPKETVIEDVTEEVQIKLKPEKKPVVTEDVEVTEEFTVKKPEEKVVEQVTEEVQIKMKPKKKTETRTEEITEDITIKKPEEPEEVTEEVTEEVLIKRKPKKKTEFKTEEISEEVVIKKKEEPEISEVSEEVVIKRKPKKKPQEEVEDISEEVTIKAPKKPEEKAVEEITESVQIKMKPKEKPKVEHEEISEEITIKEKEKEIEKVTEEVTEEVQIKMKPKKKPSKAAPEEVTEELTIIKPEEEPAEQIEEEITEEVQFKLRPKKRPQPKYEEIEEEVTVLKKREEKTDEITEDVKITMKPKVEPVEKFEDVSEEVTIKEEEPQELLTEEMTEDVQIKLKKKKKPEIRKEEVTEEMTIIKQEELEEEEIKEEPEQVHIKRKPKKRQVVTEEISEEFTVQKPKKEEPVEEVVEEFKLKRPKPRQPEGSEDVSEEVTIRQESPEPKVSEEVTEEVSIKMRPRKKKPVVTEEVSEAFTIKKPKPKEEGPSEVSETVTLKRKEEPFVRETQEISEEVEMKLREGSEFAKEETTEDVHIRMKQPKKKYSVAEETVESKMLIHESDDEDSDTIYEDVDEYVVMQQFVDEDVSEETVELKLGKPRKPVVVKDEGEEQVTIKRKKVVVKEVDETDVSGVIRRPGSPEEVQESFQIKLPKKKKPEYKVEEEEEVQVGFRIKKEPKFKVTDDVEETFRFREKESEEEEEESSASEYEDVESEFTFSTTEKEVASKQIEETEISHKFKLPPLPKQPPVFVQEDVQMQIQVAPQSPTEAFEIAPPLNVKQGDQLRAVATYVSDSSQENAMHLVEGERVYIHETSNSDWWFVKKHLTLEQGYVPAKLLAEEVSYTHYVQQKLQEKIMKLPIFEKLKKGQKAEAPKMTQMQPMRVKDGQEAQFVCKIQGSPRPNITWFRQTAIIKPSEEFQIFYSDDNTATLIIKEVFPEDAGLFTCVAKNETGYSSSSAELVVEGPVSDHGSSVGASRRSLSRESSVCDILEGIPPTFANKPSVKTVEESTQLEMDVRLVAIPEPEIVWKKDGQVLRESQRVRIVRQKDVHAYRSIFIVKNSKKEDEGKYEIVAKNREGEAKTYITLRVTAPQGPGFEEKFGDQTVEDEGTIRLVARIKGVPAPDVTWSRNGKKLKVEKNLLMTFRDELAVLEIQNVKPKEDSGKYTCTATNKVGKASHSANVTVGVDVVTFKRGLESCVVEENSEVILECRTSKERECKWYKGKNELKPSKNVTIEREGLTHRLTIHTAVGSDSGRYKCTFENQSTFCNLTVKGLDDFVERLQDVEVQELEEAVLQVEVSSDKGRISWHKDGEELTNTDRIKLVSQGKVHKLVLKKATLQDEGEYTCVLGDQECTAELTVRELPAEIVRKMKDQVVSKGNKATFEVELTKGDAVITWFKDNKEIRFSDHYQLSIDGKVQRLMVYNCQGDDAGTYRAVVGRSECTATLRVELQAEGDFVTRLPSQMDVNFQSDATFVVEISKDFEVRWFRNQEEIRADQKYIMKKEVRKRILIVKNVTQADSGEYSCVLANLKTTCKMNVVLMMSAPKIPKEYQKKEFVVNKGKDVTLKVPFTATPKPKAFWYHKGQLLDTEHNQQKILATVTENEASITIKTVENIDCGEYRVKLCNDCGAAYADYTVKILDKPSKPGTPEAMKVTDNSVTIHWSAPKEDGGRVITNYIVEYMSQQQQTWTVFNQNQKITQTTVDVTQLTKEMEYCFRVSAVNEVGTSDKSDQSKFIKVCAPRTAEAPVVKEQLQAVVTGLHQKIVLRCVVTASPPPRIEWMRDGKIIQGETKYENFTATFTIQSSREDTGGMYTCRASNEAGMAECSATVAIQEAPRFEFDETKQCQTLTVGDQWSVPIKVIGYPKPKISWTRNDKPLVSTPHILIHTNEQQCTTSITIQILALEDTAVYTVTAENSAGRAQLSFNLRVLEEEKEYQVCALEVIEEEVKRERPGPPLGPLMVTEVTTTSVKLTWKTPSHDGGMAITSYYIEKLEKTQKQWQKVADVGADCRTYTVTELVEGHEYFFRVFALNPVGISDALEVSQTIVIKSPFDKPGMPIGPFDVSNMTESSLNLHWDEPESDGGSPITHYVLEKRESNKKAWSKVGQTSADVTNMEVTGLKKGTAYYFRVFAYNAVGQGPPLQPEEPITAGKKITPPSKPNSLQVIDVTTKTVTLAWAPPTTTGGADLMGYVIERRLLNAKWEKVDTVDASVTLYCVENLKEKSEYEFRVFAENPVGLSVEAAITESVRLKTHAMPPSPPTAPLEVRPTGPTSLMIEWGAPESDGGAPLLGYIIAIRDIKRTMWIEVGQVGANFTRLHIKELQEEHEYFVRVFARNEVGSSDPLEIDEPVKIIRPADFTELPEDDAAPSLSYSTTETLSWMREAGMDADIYSYARGRLLNRDEYFFKVWHRGVDKPDGQK